MWVKPRAVFLVTARSATPAGPLGRWLRNSGLAQVAREGSWGQPTRWTAEPGWKMQTHRAAGEERVSPQSSASQSSVRRNQCVRGAGMIESGASVVTEVALGPVVGWRPGQQFGRGSWEWR